MIYVFLNNKLISCDSIVPLILEIVYDNSGVEVEFCAFDRPTYDAIEENIVLRDAIKSIGQLKYRGVRETEGYRFANTVRAVLWLGYTSAKAALGFATIVHFKALNNWPMRAFGLFAKKRVVYVQGSAIGYGKLEQRVSELMLPRSYSADVPVGDTLVAFQSDWAPLHDPRLHARQKFVLPLPYARKVWIDFLHKTKDKYLQPELDKLGCGVDGKVAVFVLSWLGPSNLLKTPDSFFSLLEETLDCMEKASPDLYILIKPHPATRVAEKRKLESMLAHRKSNRIAITHIHPMTLSMGAKFVVGNAYSTTFSTFSFCNVPTIEYTDYAPKILEETEGGSMRPEFVSYFINRDPVALTKTVEKLAREAKSVLPKGDSSPLPRELLEFFRN